jgi:hypothetical protein
MLEARNLPSRSSQLLAGQPERVRDSSPDPTRARGEGRVKPALAILFAVISLLSSLSLFS